MKKLISILIAAILFTTTACAAGGKTSSKGVLPMKLNIQIDNGNPQKSPDTPGSPEGNTEGPGSASSEPLLPS